MELCGSRLNLSPCLMVFLVLPCPKSQGDGGKFLGVFKNDGDGPSGAGRPSKTFPEVPIEFPVLCGKPESRLIIPLGLGIFKGWLGTWSLRSCSLSQDRRILSHLTRNSPCLYDVRHEVRTDLLCV